jgi:hypothetical protein
MKTSMSNELHELLIPAHGNMTDFRIWQESSGAIKYQYLLPEEDAARFPDFVGQVRTMERDERRRIMYMGGTIAGWLKSLEGMA